MSTPKSANAIDEFRSTVHNIAHKSQGIVSHLLLRTASTDDVQELVRIAHTAVAQSGYSAEQIAAWTNGLTEERISASLEHDLVLVAEEGVRMKGFATLIERGENAGEIDLLYVDPDFKRSGVGRILVRGIEDSARQREMSAIWVDASAPAAHRLQSLGYRVHDDYKKTIDSVVFHNTWMVKRLSS